MHKYFVYYRKSTDEIDRQVLSLDGQEREVRALANREGLKIVGEFEESCSAKAPGRPLFNRLLQRIQNGDANGILVWDLDRLYRNPADEGNVRWMLQQGVIQSIRTISRSYVPEDAGLLMAVEGSRGTDFIIKHRRDVMRGVRDKLLAGEWPGPRPLGYIYDHALRNVVPDHAHSKVVENIFREFASGEVSLSQLSERMTERGVLSRNGKAWTKSWIFKLLTNKLYIGIMVWRGESFEGKFKPLVSHELFADVQKILRNRSRPRNRRKGHDFPFRGLFRCSCGSMITAQWARGRRGGRYRYHRCSRNVRTCKEAYIQEKDVAAQSWTRLAAIGISATQATTLRQLIAEQGKTDSSVYDREKETVSNRLTEIQNQLNLLTRGYLKQLIDEESYRQSSASLIDEKTRLKHQRAQFLRLRSNHWIEPLHDVVATLELAGKRENIPSESEIARLLRKTVSNPLISAKKITFEFSGMYELAAQFLAQIRLTPPPDVSPADNALYSRTHWWLLLNDLRAKLADISRPDDIERT